MNDTLSASAICPFFNRHSKYSISCKSEENAEYAICLKFNTERGKNDFAVKNCCKFTYPACKVFKILMEGYNAK